jgi:uncharacterized membrane protein
MSDKYYLWLQELELRDQTYMQLGVIVLGLLLGWYLIGALIPAGWRDMVGKGYALMIAILYLVTLGATVFNG